VRSFVAAANGLPLGYSFRGSVVAENGTPWLVFDSFDLKGLTRDNPIYLQLWSVLFYIVHDTFTAMAQPDRPVTGADLASFGTATANLCLKLSALWTNKAVVAQCPACQLCTGCVCTPDALLVYDESQWSLRTFVQHCCDTANTDVPLHPAHLANIAVFLSALNVPIIPPDAVVISEEELGRGSTSKAVLGTFNGMTVCFRVVRCVPVWQHVCLSCRHMCGLGLDCPRRGVAWSAKHCPRA
jgi:hypothetical protein